MMTAELHPGVLVEIEIDEKCPALLDVTSWCTRCCPGSASHKAVFFHQSLRVKESTQGHPEINRLPKCPGLRAYVTQAIDSNLPEIIYPRLEPLYALFDLFELSMQQVAEELIRMRTGNF